MIWSSLIIFSRISCRWRHLIQSSTRSFFQYVTCFFLSLILSLIFLAKLTKEIGCISSRYLWETRLYKSVLNWFCLHLLLVFSGLQKFSSKVPLSFKCSFIFINSKLLKQIIIIIFNQTLKDFKFHHVVIILRILRFYVANLIHRSLVKQIIKFLYSLNQISIYASMLNINNSFLFIIE